jgi:hypothetical protein
VACLILREQGLYLYHVQWVQALQPNDYIRRQEFCEWVIQKCVGQPNFLRSFLVTTRICSNTNPGRCTKFCKGDNLHRRTQACIRNHEIFLIVRTLLFSYGFCFDFSFHLVFTLNPSRFCDFVYLKWFLAI